MDNGFVDFKIENGIANITFGHQNSNSLPGDILRKLSETISNLNSDENAKVIVLKSQGERAFCAGASFDELVQINDFEVGKSFFMGFALVINAIRKSNKFVIVRVQGKAVGGGVGLASAGDYTFATKYSDAKLSELALGIGPFVVGPAVERKIGNSAFSQMSIDYEWYNAEWCLQKGLYNNVSDSIEEMDKKILAFAFKMANNSPEAMEDLKRVIWKGTENWDELLESRAEISGRLVLSDFTKNYITNFKNK
jgi:methylglutaconyl-CoA hydratase